MICKYVFNIHENSTKIVKDMDCSSVEKIIIMIMMMKIIDESQYDYY